MDLLDAIFEIEDEQVVQENRRLDTAPTCKIYMDGDIITVLLPCQHLLCCERCAEQLKKCLRCRSSILGTLKTFLLINWKYFNLTVQCTKLPGFGISLVKSRVMFNMDTILYIVHERL